MQQTCGERCWRAHCSTIIAWLSTRASALHCSITCSENRTSNNAAPDMVHRDTRCAALAPAATHQEVALLQAVQHAPDQGAVERLGQSLTRAGSHVFPQVLQRRGGAVELQARHAVHEQDQRGRAGGGVPHQAVKSHQMVALAVSKGVNGHHHLPLVHGLQQTGGWVSGMGKGSGNISGSDWRETHSNLCRVNHKAGRRPSNAA